MSGGNGHATKLQAARCWQGGDDDALQAVRAGGPGGIDGIGETEIGRREGIDAVFQGGDGFITAGGRLVDRGDINTDRVGRGIQINAAIGGAAVVAHLEAEGADGVAIDAAALEVLGVDNCAGRCAAQRGGIDADRQIVQTEGFVGAALAVGEGEAEHRAAAGVCSADRNHACAVDPAAVAVVVLGQAHRSARAYRQTIRGAKVAEGLVDQVGVVQLHHQHVAVGPAARIGVYRVPDGQAEVQRDLAVRAQAGERQHAGAGVVILQVKVAEAAVGRKALGGLHAARAAPGGANAAVGVDRWRIDEGAEAGSGDLLTGGDCGTTEQQAACARQAGEDHALQAVGPRRAGGVDRVGEAEIGRRERIDTVFSGGDRAVGASRRVVHRGDIDADRVGCGIEITAVACSAAVVAHLEGEGSNGVAVGIGRWRVGEGGEAGYSDFLTGSDFGASEQQAACAWQAGDDHALQAVGPGGASGIGGIGEAEIGRREAVGGVFQGGDGLVGAGGGIVHRADRDRERAGCGGEAVGEGVRDHTSAVEIRGWGEDEVAAAEVSGAIGHGAEAGDAQGIALGIVVVSDQAGQTDRDRGLFRGGGAVGHR